MSSLSNVYYKMAHICKNKDNTKKKKRKLVIDTIIINHCVMALFIA